MRGLIDLFLSMVPGGNDEVIILLITRRVKPLGLPAATAASSNQRAKRTGISLVLSLRSPQARALCLNRNNVVKQNVQSDV